LSTGDLSISSATASQSIIETLRPHLLSSFPNGEAQALQQSFSETKDFVFIALLDFISANINFYELELEHAIDILPEP
jgi:hypothetical protein